MRSYLKILVFLAAGVVLAGATTLAMLRGQEPGVLSGSQRRLPPDLQRRAQERLNRLPLVDYDAPAPADPAERARRSVKNLRFNRPSAPHTLNPILHAEIGTISSEWELGLESSLPVAQSSAIIVGEVVEAKAFLSENRAAIYSEFVVRIEEVLKNDGDEPIAVGDTVAINRLGGRVRFPSGRISSFYSLGQDMPEVGRRYLFFLGYNPREGGNLTISSPREMNRYILTGYELREGEVFPLDAGGAINFSEHQGKTAVAFLSEIRRAIANP